MKKRTTLAISVAVALSMLAGCSAADSTSSGEEIIAAGEDTVASDSSTSDVAVESAAVTATTEENAATHDNTDDYVYEEADVVEISLGATIAADSDSVTVDGTTATITAAGTYRISGTAADADVVVDAGDSVVVQLILDNADITNTDGAAIAVMSAETTIVILADGSSNTLTDGSVYVLAEGEDEPNAALYSKSDLTITGTGSLAVVGNYNDGIASKDGLVIDSGDITVVAVDDGIRGKDYVVVSGGEIDVTSGGDGIKSDNDEDPELGYVTIADGVINVTSDDDGVQAATDVLVTGGTLTISAGASGASDDARAVQGDVSVVISGGTITADATDDAIHSNSEVTIDGGDLTLASGDDAIHGDYFVTVNGGSIVIAEAFEGIESEVLTINDGFIDITSSDDGLNVASADATATTTDQRGGGGPGGGGVGDFYIYINGGTIVITVSGELAEQGDGIDANGHVEMTGGVVVVSGPTDTRNSAVDYSGGSFEVSGGLFIGTNINGRNSEGVGIDSTQASIYVTTDSVIDTGTVLHLQTTDGDTLVTFLAENVFDVIVFTSPELVAGETYEIYLGGSVSGDSTTGLYDDAAYTLGTLAGTVAAS